MSRRLLVLLVPFTLLAACSKDSPAVKPPASSSTTTSTAVTVPTTEPSGGTSTTTPSGPGIALTGPAGSGTVAYALHPDRSELCYRITVRGVETPTGAHLLGRDGQAVLDLQAPPMDGTVNTCAAADSILMEEIQSQPSDFTVEVLTPKGTLKAVLE